MNHMRSRQILRGVASLTAAIVLLLGVPLLLARLVGWPLPTSMPSANAFQQATQSGLSDDVVINVLAVVIWVTWAQLVLAVAVETIAVFHGRQVGRIPVLPGLQITAARLVAGVLMVTSTVRCSCPTFAQAYRRSLPASVFGGGEPPPPRIRLRRSSTGGRS